MTFDRWIYLNFPNLRKGGCQETSGYTDEYNCIAYAADDTDNWWWPHPDSYWPEGVPRLVTMDAFVQAYQTLNYEPCSDGTIEAGFEKIVIYADAMGKPTHAARQLPSGKWTSKLGEGWDITHDSLEGIECAAYGKAAQFMKRPTK